jgi:CheY-like chemotaxis protein/two-component sensor histidine kinase
MAIDITERIRAEEALRDADQRKTDFLATLSHELRNPLAPIRNSIEVIKRSAANPRLVETSLEVMDRQLDQMVRLVDDLLDVSRITRDRLELRTGRVDLGDVIARAIETCDDLIGKGGHAIDVSLPPERVYLSGDAARLVQVFSNLIDNACKYTAKPASIRVTVKRSGEQIVVSVIDDGLGIPADAHERIFEMFTRVESGRSETGGSLGIGLALVKRIVELHGGSVTVRSDGPDRGSEFIIRLPAEVTAPELVPLIDDAPLGRATAHAMSPLRVLVVDDNEDSADSLAELLRFSGHETVTANDGPEALTAADRFRPHVAILDVGLPTMSGHDVCRQLRTQPWARDLFIVALTGWGQEEDRRKSREAGFDDHFVKPLDHAELLTRLQSVPGRPN